MRAFVAVELDPRVRAPLLGVLRALPPTREARWVTPEQLHVTLRFLGAVEIDQLDAVRDVIARAARAIAPFEVALTQLGCFPSPRSPRVLWIGVRDDLAGCRRWVETADPWLAAIGYPPEERAYTPHLTLGRSKSPAGGRILQEAVENLVFPATPSFTIGEVVLFESKLRPTGPVYTAIERFPLGI